MSNLSNYLDIKCHLSLLFMMENERLLVRNTLKNTANLRIRSINVLYQSSVLIKKAPGLTSQDTAE